MKKLRILFLAVLATALVVSGAFAADKLPAKSFDVTKVSNGEEPSTADGLVSVDLWSPDKTLTVSIDVPSGYEISWEDVSGYTVTSADGKVYATLTASSAKSGDKFAITFTLTSTDSGSSSEEEASYTYNTSTKYQFAYAGTAGKVAYYTLAPIETANELDSAYEGKYYTMTETEGVQTYTEAEGELDKNDNGSYWRVTVDDTADKLTIPATEDGTTYALDKGDGTYQAVDKFEQGDTDNKYHKVTVFDATDDNADVTGKYEKSSAGVYTVTVKTGTQEEGEFFTISTEEADIITVEAEVTYALQEEKTYTTATEFTPGDEEAEYVVITTEQGLLYASLGEKWNEDVTGNSNKRYATAAYDDEGTVTYTVVDTTVVTKPAEGVTYFVITPKAAEITEEADITAGDKFIGNEAAGTYTPATEWITEGTLTFPAYDKDTKYVTILSSKDVTSEVTNDNFSKGIYYKYDSSTGHFSRDTDAYSTKNKYFRLAVSEWKAVAAADLVEGTDYYTSADADPTIEETKESAVFDEMTLRQSYATADTKPSYTLTLTVTYRDKASTTGEEEPTGTPDIALKDVSSIQNKTVTLYVSGDAKTYSGTLVVSADYKDAEFSFDVSPAPKAWSFDAEYDAPVKSDDNNYKSAFDLILTPSETVSQSKTAYTLTVCIVGSEDIEATMTFNVEVLVSSSKSGDDSEGDGSSDTSTAELKMETPAVTSTDLMQGQTAKVTITVTPQAALGTYKFAYDDADKAFTITAGSERQVSAVTGNAVEYDLQASIEADPGKYVVTFTVTSGDQKVSADVEFTVKALSFTGMNDTEKTNYIKNNPAPKPADETTADQKAANEKAFADGAGEAKFKFRSEWPVKTKGWRLLFMRGSARNVLLNFMRWLLGGEYQYYEASMISALSIVASADNTDAITVNVGEDGYTAEYVVDVQKTASGLAKGEKFAVTPAVIPEAYDNADTANVADEVKESAGDSVGTMTGASTSDTTPGGDTPGGDTPGGDEGGEEEGDAVNFLGGSSGGCDAGFGALALALAASMIFVRKRS